MLKQSIPFVDLRGKTPVDLLRSYPDKAYALVKSARRTFGMASYLASAALMPLADRRARSWLTRTDNPYLHEIESMADVLECRGVYALNLSYEWGCTSGLWRCDDSISMLRVLDWPFPALGKHLVIAQQKGRAGEFFNLTWPGVAGVFTGMAPGRFSAALNQAPMRRHGRAFAGDWLTNFLRSTKTDALPAAHLLRQVFETASSYTDAKEMLTKTPIAVPAIFILGGTRQGEGCIIQRLENDAEIFELSADQCAYATNHFTGDFASKGKGWRPREIDSAGRYRHAGAIAAYELEQPHFNWLRAPIINANTRMCVIADAQSRRLMVQGYEGSLPVTELFHRHAVEHDQQEAV